MHNPVHWLPYGPEAWAKAQAERKLVLVSVGYSACHWCHVMEHETFSNAEAADFMNAHFVCIKVDREERPDVDQVYMEAVQLMTRQGGWPLNCIALPDGRPIWGSVYLPKNQWLSSLQAILDVESEHPERVRHYAEKLTMAVDAMGQIAGPEEVSLLDSFDSWTESWDLEHGGRLGAPKFPLPGQLEFLGRASHSKRLGPKRQAQARAHALRTLGAVVRGGIHDHVGGGFARYSVDEAWHVPHFEKMLYDNAQLVSVLAEWADDSNPGFTEALTRALAFMEREWRLDHGGFCAALDADSEGQEGTYYLWTQEELNSLLTQEEVGCLHAAFGLDGHSLWEHGQHVLRQVANAHVNRRDLQDVLHKLQTWRDGPEGRIKPGLDNKVLTSWNALTAIALAKAARFHADLSMEPALRLGQFLQAHARMPHRSDLLRRTSHADGGPLHEGFAEDYAFTVEAFLELHQSTQDRQWLMEARALMATAMERLFDPESKTFWNNARGSDTPFVRSRSMDDGVIPSANASFASNLWKLGWALDIEAWRALSRHMVQARFAGGAALAESGKWGCVHLDQTESFTTVVVAVASADQRHAVTKAWWTAKRPGTWLDVVGPGDAHIPTWMEGKRPGAEGQPRWYVCQEGACQLAVNTAEQAWDLCPLS